MKRRFVNKIEKNDSPKTTIQTWLSSSTIFEDDINFKEIARLSNKEIKRNLFINKTDDGRYIIKSRSCTYDLWYYYNDPKRYYDDLFRLIKTIRSYIHNEEYKPTSVVYTYPKDNTVHQMSLIHFTFNMIMWLPLFILNIDITKETTFMPKVFNNKTYVEFINTKIIEPYKNLTTHNEMSKILAKMYDLFIIISEQYSLDLGISFSLHDLISRWDNPEIYDLNHTEIPSDMQISEAENYLNDRVNRYVDIMTNEEGDNVLKPLLRSGQGANIKQLREFAISVGYKPDINGYTVPYAPKTCFITNGLRKVEDLAQNALGGRKSSVLALCIDSSGYLARTYSKSASNVYLNPDPNYDCGSTNYYEKPIKTKYDLTDMDGRWYVHGKTLRQLKSTDYELIGQTLKFRSPTTCASKNGICSVCYGKLYSQNVGINIGILAALLVSERSYQNTLSAKHALDTTTNIINLTADFYDYFKLNNGYCVRVRDDLEMPENYVLKINRHSIILDQDIQDLQDNEYITEFVIHNKEEETEIHIEETRRNNLYIAPYLFKIIVEKRKNKDYDSEGWISIPLEKLDCDEDILYAKLQNYELTRPLNEIKSLIEKGKEVSGVNTPSELINKMNELLRNGGVFTNSVHIEVIARNLVRDKNNPTQLPDYTKKNPEFIITSIHNSILNSNSVVTSLTFERIQNQLSNPITYKKNGTSPLDRLCILE